MERKVHHFGKAEELRSGDKIEWFGEYGERVYNSPFTASLASWGELIGTSSVILRALISVKYQSCTNYTWTLICVGTKE
jgi:hypothetical protein